MYLYSYFKRNHEEKFKALHRVYGFISSLLSGLLFKFLIFAFDWHITLSNTTHTPSLGDFQATFRALGGSDLWLLACITFVGSYY